MKGNRRTRRVRVVAGGESLVSSAGGGLLVETAMVVGLDRALRQQLARWRASRVTHDPGKIVLDLATAIALGGDCLADLAVVRSQPDLFGLVASDPTVCRLLATLAADAPAALQALRTARAQARQQVWALKAPVDDDGPVIIDVDATIVQAHSEKEGATPTFKRTFGFHPLLAFVDHGTGGTGECLAGLLRPGRSTANDAADHVAVLTAALAQLPEDQRSRVLVRGDSGAGVHAFIKHLHDLRLQLFGGDLRPRASHRRAACGATTGLAGGAEHQRGTSRRRAGRRTHPLPAARPGPLADRDARDRPPRTPAPRRPTAPDRRRWLAHNAVRDKRQRRQARGP
jgi:hypothetical protein